MWYASNMICKVGAVQYYNNNYWGTNVIRAVACSLMGGRGGLIFIYSSSAQLMYFEINCFYGLRTRIYEYEPPPPQLSSLLINVIRDIFKHFSTTGIQ